MGWSGTRPWATVDAEALGQDRAECLDLHLAETGELSDPGAKVLGVRSLRPYGGRISAISLVDEGAEVLDPPSHRTREAMDRRLLPEDLLEPGGIHPCDLGGIEAPEPLLQLERSEERRRHCHLLIESEPDQEREWIAGDERIGFRVPREVKRVGHGPSLDRARRRQRAT